MALGKVSRKLNKPCILLIVIAGMERLAFKGVASNLVTYLTDVMKMSNSSAAKFVNNWVGFTWIMPLAVAALADSYWDRYTTVLGFSLLYAMGLLALTLTSVQWPWLPTNKTRSISSLSLSLYMISLGQGGYNPSLQAFGADQLEDEHELPSITDNGDQNKSNSDDNKKSLFFQWWYFGVCSGSLLGVSVMSYIQDNLGWGLGFAIPTLSMLISILMFLFGNRFYMHKQGRSGDGKSLEEIVRAIKARVSKLIKGGNGLPRDAVDELELEEKPLCCSCEEDLDHKNTPDFSDNHEENVHPLKAAKILLGLLPIWIMLLLFAVIFQQPATFFTKQGMTMKRNIGHSKFKIPPAALQSAITISIVILMPWYDTFFIPLVRIFTKKEKGITVMQRIGIGMFLSVIAMVIAAIVEKKRLHISHKMVKTSQEQEVPFSIFWLLPQYVLLGISDIFTVVGMQEFFYSEVPVSMRTMGIALYSSVFGVGSFLSAVLISVIEYITNREGNENSWFSDDMNKTRLDKYYWWLAFLSAVSLLAFVVFCKCFRQRCC